MGGALEREDIIDGLTELVRRVRASGLSNDVVNLLVLNSIRSVEEAERLFESFYPGDALEPRTIELLERIYELGLPSVPVSPALPRLD